MNTRFNQRVYDILMEGRTTGGNPEATGRRVGHFVGRVTQNPRKPQPNAEGARSLSQAQRYHHIRRIARIHHKLRKRAGKFNSPNAKRAADLANQGHIEGRSAVQTGITAPDHYETGQHLINQTRTAAAKKISNIKTKQKGSNS